MFAFKIYDSNYSPAQWQCNAWPIGAAARQLLWDGRKFPTQSSRNFLKGTSTDLYCATVWEISRARTCPRLLKGADAFGRQHFCPSTHLCDCVETNTHSNPYCTLTTAFALRDSNAIKSEGMIG